MIANAPIHCQIIIFSEGTRTDALVIATMTSDIIKIPTRPGNKNCDTLKIIMNPGNKIITDQNKEDGSIEIIREISGNGSL